MAITATININTIDGNSSSTNDYNVIEQLLAQDDIDLKEHGGDAIIPFHAIDTVFVLNKQVTTTTPSDDNCEEGGA